MPLSFKRASCFRSRMTRGPLPRRAGARYSCFLRILPRVMNADLLMSVQRAIARNPDRFCAAQWAFARNADRVLRKGHPPEGFRCCIAGHVLLESDTLAERDLLREGGFHTGGALWNRAAAVLEMSVEQGRELFFPSQWDRPFKQRYYLCGQDEEAEVATAYIRYFLQKHGCAEERGTEGGESGPGGDRSPRVPTADERRKVSVEPQL